MPLRYLLAALCAVVVLLFAFSAGACPDRCTHAGHHPMQDEAVEDVDCIAVTAQT